MPRAVASATRNGPRLVANRTQQGPLSPLISEDEIRKTLQEVVNAFMDMDVDSDEVQSLWDNAFSLRRRFRQTGFRLARCMRPERPLTRLAPEPLRPPPPPPLLALPPPPPTKQEEAKAQAVVNWIGKLHELYQKKLGMDRKTQKQEIRFDTEKKPGNGIHQLMFQSTVHAQEFKAGPFVGDECTTKKAAEHSAARVAVESEFPHFREEAQAPTEPTRRKNRKKRAQSSKRDREESQSDSSESEESEKRVKTEKSD